MRFQGAATITAGVAGPDPQTNPQDVPLSAFLLMPLRNPNTDSPILALYATLDAGAGETVTGEFWALDVATLPDDHAPSGAAELGTRRFYRFATGVVLTRGILTLVGVAGLPPPIGPIYFRRTADTLATIGIVRASSATS